LLIIIAPLEDGFGPLMNPLGEDPKALDRRGSKDILPRNVKVRRKHLLRTRTLMSARAYDYRAETPGLPLSLKCISNGQARYRFAGREFTIDDGGWLVVNDGQPYSIEIASPSIVETFIVWFPRGWADEVLLGLDTPGRQLLDEPERQASRVGSVNFFERYTPNEELVAPAVGELRMATRFGQPIDDMWLEQRLRGLLARMLSVQRSIAGLVALMPAVRAATREELWRRLNRARDFIHSRCEAPLSLGDVAKEAAMSPYHFLRTFKEAFGKSPYDWVTECRVERAKLLLAHTELPVTEICFETGFEALGSYSTWFRKHTGFSPRAWRREFGAFSNVRNFREVFPQEDAVGSLPTT
jgi:AraC family transcriptional regulator